MDVTRMNGTRMDVINEERLLSSMFSMELKDWFVKPSVSIQIKHF